MPVRRRTTVRRRNSASRIPDAFSTIMHSLDEIARQLGVVVTATLTIASDFSPTNPKVVALARKLTQLDEDTKAARTAAARLRVEIED